MYYLLPKSTPTSTLWNVRSPDGRMLKWSLDEGLTPQQAAAIIRYCVQAPVAIVHDDSTFTSTSEPTYSNTSEGN